MLKRFGHKQSRKRRLKKPVDRHNAAVQSASFNNGDESLVALKVHKVVDRTGANVQCRIPCKRSDNQGPGT